eukprot:GHVL01030570.1.p1 GENE.GHVL01030570.1~~GHVL01030570.1.p1  ORF type:complete len:298 (+),score=55.20 GHVL01030570.1:343-1236(+)
MQRDVQLKIEEAEKEVCKSMGFSRNSLRDAEKIYEKDPEVCLLMEEVKNMIQDVVEGRMPVLKGVHVPPALTKTKVLEIVDEININKNKRFNGILSNAAQMTNPSLAEALGNACTEAQKHVLKNHEKILGTEGELAYKVVYAKYSNEKEFSDKLQQIATSQKLSMLNLIRAYSPSKESSTLTELSSKLDKTTAEELGIRLESVRESKTPLVLLMIDVNRNVDITELLIFSGAIENTSIDCTCVYMSLPEGRKCKEEIVLSSSSYTSGSEEPPLFYVLFNGETPEKFQSIAKLMESLQ